METTIYVEEYDLKSVYTEPEEIEKEITYCCSLALTEHGNVLLNVIIKSDYMGYDPYQIIDINRKVEE